LAEASIAAKQTESGHLSRQQSRRCAMDLLLFRRLYAGFAPVRITCRTLGAIYRGLERSRQRRALNRLSDALLRDIGLTRGDAAREIEKPFWR
jgi:uncharacterized protein YjiS (DUF1127 family)